MACSSRRARRSSLVPSPPATPCAPCSSARAAWPTLPASPKRRQEAPVYLVPGRGGRRASPATEYTGERAGLGRPQGAARGPRGDRGRAAHRRSRGPRGPWQRRRDLPVCCRARRVDAVLLTLRVRRPAVPAVRSRSRWCAVFAIPYARMTTWYDGLTELKSGGFRGPRAGLPTERDADAQVPRKQRKRSRFTARHRGGRALRAAAARGERDGAHPDEPGRARRRSGFPQRSGRRRHRLPPSRAESCLSQPHHRFPGQSPDRAIASPPSRAES